jgi:hypothetical protein
MPPGHGDDGLVAAQAIRRHPDVGVLVFSHYLDSRYAGRLLARRGPGGRRTLQDCVITPWSAETAARGGRPSPAVDGLVADVPVRAVHKRAAQMLGDLLPPPLQLKLGLHQLAQFAVKGSACLVAGGGCAAEPGLGHTDNDIVVEVPDVVFAGPGRGGGATGLQRRVPTRLAIHIGQTRR